MKQQLTEAYEGEHCNECGRSYGDTVYSVPDSVWAVIHERAPAGLLCPTCALDRLARLVERLLPGECGHCEGTGTHAFIGAFTNQTGESVFYRCSRCHGSGQVWDEGIVEAVSHALQDLSLYTQDPVTGGISGFDPERVARAVLLAIAQLAEAGSQ